MLVGARDEKGTTNIYSFRHHSEEDLEQDENGDWTSKNGTLIGFDDDQSNNACRDIPSGSWKEIDLSASTIVHVVPNKTAVEELIEACEELRDCYTDHGSVKASIEVGYTRPLREKMFSALARVRQEEGK